MNSYEIKNNFTNKVIGMLTLSNENENINVILLDNLKQFDVPEELEKQYSQGKRFYLFNNVKRTLLGKTKMTECMFIESLQQSDVYDTGTVTLKKQNYKLNIYN